MSKIKFHIPDDRGKLYEVIVFNGNLLVDQTFDEIRARVRGQV